jgi:diguanylate cyclase (GGDEF)-like protein/PAS domain S-box-containing protein
MGTVLMDGKMSRTSKKAKPASASQARPQTGASAAAQVLRASEIRYRRLFETAQDGILILEAKSGAIVDVNPYLITMLGYSRQDFVTKKLWEVGAFQDIEASKSAFLALQRNKYIRYENLPLKTKDGRLVQVEFVSNEYSVGRRKVIQCNIRDITERKLAEQQLAFYALRDPLTGLFNRLEFNGRLLLAFEHAKRDPAYHYVVLFVDLDRFKVVNDSLGHFAGDELLVSVTRRLEKHLRATDTFARLGGDEFAILLDNRAEVMEGVRAAQRVLEELSAVFMIEGHELFTTASIGIAESGPSYTRPEDLLRDADSALYRAKALGGARYAVFDTPMHARAVALLQLETELRRALDHHEFVIHYQPIVFVRTGQLAGFETLVRWQHPTRGLLEPKDFLELAEETGLLNPIGDWLLSEACLQLRRWQIRFPGHPALTVSVNLSPKQFLQADLVEQVTRVLRETGLTPSQLCLEITENVISLQEPAPAIMSQLHHLGVQLHIDDFGTGYSSLNALNQIELTALKIDRVFVKMLDGIERQNAIARTAVRLAHELGLSTIAEGVETPEQLAYLKTVDCELGQGYLFGRPMSLEASTKYLASALTPQDR